jgi:hypothetical protein
MSGVVIMKGCIRVITSRRVLLGGVQAGPVDPVDQADRMGPEDRVRDHPIILVVPRVLVVPAVLVATPSQLQ